MLKYRGAHLIRSGVIRVVLLVLVLAVGLQPGKLIAWGTPVRLQGRIDHGGGAGARN